MLKLFYVVTLLAIAAGCNTGESGLPTGRYESAGIATLDEKVAVVEKFLPAARTYETLDFHIDYWNNSGGWVPGPSAWDIRLVAIVPQSELDQWIEGMSPDRELDRAWLAAVPTNVDTTGVVEWYSSGPRTIGIDRERRVVVYREVVK